MNFSHLHLSLYAVPWWSILSLWLQVYSQYTWLTNLNCSPETPWETETFVSAWLLNICLLMTQRHCRYLMSNQTRIPIFLPNLFFFSGTLLQFCKPEIQSYTSCLTLSQLHSQSFSKSYWFYFPSVFWVYPLFFLPDSKRDRSYSCCFEILSMRWVW